MIYRICLIFLVCLHCLHLNAQTEKPILTLESIQSESFKKLPPFKYVDSVNKFLRVLNAKGMVYPKDTLIHYLKTFRTYVWQNEGLKNQKAAYYINLGNNASAQNKFGEAIFFFEKADKEDELLSLRKPGFVLMNQCYLYNQNKNFRRAIEAFEKQLSWFESFSEEIVKNNLSEKEIMVSMYILSPVACSYIFLNDTIGTNKTIEIAHNILQASVKRTILNTDQTEILWFLYNCMLYFKNRYLLNDEIKTKEIIDICTNRLNYNGISQPVKESFQRNYIEWLTNYFIFTGNIDSATYYLNKMKEAPSAMVDKKQNNLNIKINELKIKCLKDGNQEILNLTDEVLNLSDTINIELNNQIDDMLYAYTKAEFADEELKLAEADNSRKRTIILTISIIAIFTTIGIYIKMRNKHQKIKMEIDVINNLSNLKIATLEATKQEAIKEEQERMAQEMHDNVSSVLAGLQHQVDEILITSNNKDKKEMEKIKDGLQYIYSNVRTKSHQLFFDSGIQQHASFLETLNFLVNGSLPDKKYKKYIEVDVNAILLLTLEDRINILRIIQEALTNIIKHSKATELSIMLISTTTEIILQIIDNGIGLKKEIKKGMGMLSIFRRVKQLNGTLEIINDDGFTLIITINKNKMIKFKDYII
mgnify:CR=1 FL=1